MEFGGTLLALDKRKWSDRVFFAAMWVQLPSRRPHEPSQIARSTIPLTSSRPWLMDSVELSHAASPPLIWLPPVLLERGVCVCVCVCLVCLKCGGGGGGDSGLQRGTEGLRAHVGVRVCLHRSVRFSSTLRSRVSARLRSCCAVWSRTLSLSGLIIISCPDRQSRVPSFSLFSFYPPSSSLSFPCCSVSFGTLSIVYLCISVRIPFDCAPSFF
jgi:hypothetical protein